MQIIYKKYCPPERSRRKFDEIFLIILLSIIIYSCSVSAEEKSDTKIKIESPEAEITDSLLIDTLVLDLKITPQKKYSDWKYEAKSEWKKLNAASKIINSDSLSADEKAKIYIENLILNKLIPHWYGTPWDFNGYTETPKNGVIACGYFVSTVMKHAGFNIDRYKLAQQNPFNEACTIALADTVDIYNTGSHALQETFNKNYKEGLYFTGLDFHVGFLLFRNKELYFIHSNYIGSKGVMIEKAVYSEAFNASTTYRIAPFSTNEKLIKKWLKGEEIKVKMK